MTDETTTTLPATLGVSLDETVIEEIRPASEHHDRYEKTHAEHQWWDWYAPYLSARQNGSSPEEAAAAADRYMEKPLHVPVD